MTEAIGWLSSLVLFATLLSQIRTQWRARHTEGVSTWLFILILRMDQCSS